MAPARTPYTIILSGLALFLAGMAIDLAQHGVDFLITEFRESPWAHGLPSAGVLLVMVGAFWGWRRTRKDSEQR